MNNLMIDCRQLTKVYGANASAVTGIDRLDLSVAQGEFVVVRGPSGCGKTTLLLMLGGMLRPTSGHLLVDGRDLYALPSRKRNRFRADTIGFVFQMFHLVPYLSVLDNVLLAGHGAFSERPARRAKAESLLGQLGLAHRLHHRPAQLSAGERQRAALARALLNQPKLILADEPTGNLDPDNAAEVLRHLEAFHRSGGTVILVTHGPSAQAYANRIVPLRQGKIETSTSS
jgi:ABC-type lipoprotein export system ATPase subunit